MQTCMACMWIIESSTAMYMARGKNTILGWDPNFRLCILKSQLEKKSNKNLTVNNGETYCSFPGSVIEETDS